MSATEVQIFGDYADFKAKRYLNEIGSGTVLEEMLKGRAADPNYDANTNEAFKESLKHIEIIKL